MSSAQRIRNAATELGAVSGWLSRAGVRHRAAAAEVRGAIGALPARWSSPDGDAVQADGRSLTATMHPVAPALDSAADAVQRLRGRGGELADRLGSLERQQREIDGELTRLGPVAAGEPELQQRLNDQRSRLEGLRREQAACEQQWDEACRQAAASVSTSVAAVEGATASVADDDQGGGSGRGLPGWAELIHDVLDGVKDVFEIVDAAVDQWHRRLTRWTQVISRRIVSTYRELRLTIEGVVRVTIRQARTIITDTRVWIQGQAPAWLRRIQGAFGRLRPAVGVLGKVLRPLGVVLAGFDRWDVDANRPDTTSTERWVRAIFEGSVRGVAQVPVIAATTALTTAAAATGPFAVVLVPGALALGVGAGIVVDEAAAWLVSKLLDDWEWSQRALRGLSDGIDATGRFLRDSYQAADRFVRDTYQTLSTAVPEAIDSVVTTVQSAASSVREAGSQFVSTVTDTITTVSDTVSDTVSTVTEGVGNAVESVTDTVSSVGSTVGDTLGSVTQTVTDSIGSGVDSLTSTVSGAGSRLGSWASRPLGRVFGG